MQRGVSALLDSNFSGACPWHGLNFRDIFLREKLCEREKEEKGKATQ
jgi:hypothetical protein